MGIWDVITCNHRRVCYSNKKECGSCFHKMWKLCFHTSSLTKTSYDKIGWDIPQLKSHYQICQCVSCRTLMFLLVFTGRPYHFATPKSGTRSWSLHGPALGLRTRHLFEGEEDIVEPLGVGVPRLALAVKICLNNLIYTYICIYEVLSLWVI